MQEIPSHFFFYSHTLLLPNGSLIFQLDYPSLLEMAWNAFEN